MTKKIIIIAGPNGAGKTTFARAFLPAEAQCLRFINADLIAAGLSPFAPDAVAIKAGRLMLLEIAELAKNGGHNIPENVIRRRYEAGWRNFEAHYQSAVDTWVVYDNAGDEPIMKRWGERT